MMNRIELSESAKLDIQDISAYTRTRYGEDQARRYIDQIYAKLSLLLEYPSLGYIHSDIPNGYRVMKAEKHYIIYTLREDVIYIARILHERTDFSNKDY